MPVIERYLRAVADASCALLTADLSTGLRRAVEVIGESTGLDRVYVSRYDHDRAAGYFECERCAPGIATIGGLNGWGPYSFNEYEEVWRPLMAGEIYSSSTREKQGANRDFNHALGTQRDLFIPIFAHGVVWGCIGFDNCTSDRSFSVPEIQVLRSVAAAIAAAVARDAVEKARLLAAQENQTRVQRWLDISGEGTWGAAINPPVDVDLPEVEQIQQIISRGVLSECNDQGARSMGYRDAADWIGRRAEEFFPANEANCAYLGAFIRSGYDLRESESNDGAGDGVDRWFLNNLRGVVVGRQLVALYGTHRDISALKRAEAALLCAEQARRAELEASNAKLRDREGLLHTVTEVARLLLDRDDFDAAVNATMETLGRAARVDRVALIKDLPNPAGITGPSRWRITHTWNVPGLASQLDISREGVHPSEEFCEQQRAGEPVVIDYPKAAADYRAALHAIGAYSTLVVPVMVDGRWWGCIGFDDGHSDRVWAAHEITTLETAAACVAAAIRRQEQARAHATRRSRYIDLLAAVGEAAAALLATDDIGSCIERAMARVGEASWADRVCVSRLDWTPDDSRVLGQQEIVHEWTKPGAIRQMDGSKRRFGMRRDDPTWESLFRELKESGHLLANIAEAGEPFRSEQTTLGIVWNLCCPIYVEGVLWGLMGFDYGQPLEDYDTADRSALQTLANTLAAALDREAKEEKRHADEQARVRQAMDLNLLLESVVDASRILIEAKDYDASLTEWLRTLAITVGADNAMLGGFISDSGGCLASVNRAWGRTEDRGYDPPPVPETRDFVAWKDALLRGEAIVAHRDQLRDPASIRYWEDWNCFSDVIVPIRSHEESRGWVSFNWSTRHELTPAHVAILRTAANGVAAALKRQEVNLALHAERENRLAAKRMHLAAERARAEASEHLTALLQVVVSSSRELLDATEFEPALLRWLGRFGNAMEATRATYYDTVYHEEAGRPTLRMLVEWVRPGVTGSIPVSMSSPYVIDPRGAEEAMNQMTSGKSVVFHTEEARGVAREFLASQGNASVVAVPLFLEGRQYGCVSLDFATRTEPTPAILAVLQTAADTLASILARDQAVRSMLDERERAAAARLEAREHALTILRTGTATLARVPDLHRFLAELMQQMIVQIGGMDAQLFLYDPERETLCASLGVTKGQAVMSAPGLVEGLPVSEPFPANVTGAWRRLVAKRDALYFDLERDREDFWPGTVEWHRARGHRGSVCIALMLGEEPLGMLGFICPGKDAFSTDELSMLAALAEQASLAIAVSRLAEQAKNMAVAQERQQAAQRRVSELAAANDTLRRATAGLVADAGVGPFLCTLMAEATRLSGAKTAGIFSYNDAKERLRMFALTTEGAAVDLATDPRMAVWRDDVPDAIARRWLEQMRTRDFASFDNHMAAADHPWPISRTWHIAMGHRYVITVPLYAGGRLVGTFGQCFADGYDVASFDFGMTRVLANHAALALHMMRLSAEARDSATAAAVHKERNRIARDLHDTLAQGFAGVIAQLGAAEGSLDVEQIAGARAYVERAKALARHSLSEARANVHSLRPSGEVAPLTTRLKRLIQDMGQGLTLSCAVVEAGQPWPLTPAMDWCAYKFAQEALANTLKHSGATLFELEIRWSDRALQLSAGDNGRGLPTGKLKRGLGLVAMAERAAEVAGSIGFGSGKSGGLVVTLELPRSEVVSP